MNDVRRAMARFPAYRIVAVVAVFLSFGSPAGAQSTFYEAYNLGIQHERSSRWDDARQAFLTAARLRPEPASRVKTYGLNFLTDYDPYLHLARAEIALGLYDDADIHLRRSSDAGVSPDAEISDLAARLEAGRRAAAPPPTAVPSPTTPAPTAAAARPTVAPTIFDLRSNPFGADVFIDGRLVGTTPVELPLSAGVHRLELRRQGHVSVKEEINLTDGQTLSRSIRLLPEPTPQTADPPPSVPSPRPTTPPRIITATPSPAASPTATPRPTATIQPVTPPAETSTATSGRARHVAVPAIVAFFVAVLTVILVRRWRARRRLRSLNETPTRHIVDTTPTIVHAHATPLPKHVKPKFGAYRLKAMLGRGGMATTYLARRKRDGQLAAVKIPHDHLLESNEFVQRFIREGSLGATAHHPNIIRIFEAGTVDGRPFIAMEFLDGLNLEQRLASTGAFPVTEALETARSIALALDYAHMKGIIHRDLKPENVMLLTDGTLKVMDYGIARIIDDPGLTGTNTYLGTPLYSAPESLEPAEVDTQSDLYSLGIILYRLLSNRLPFESQSPLKLLELHRSQPLPPFPPELRIPDEVVALVVKLTAKNKEDRYPSAEAFIQDVNAILNAL